MLFLFAVFLLKDGNDAPKLIKKEDVAIWSQILKEMPVCGDYPNIEWCISKINLDVRAAELAIQASIKATEALTWAQQNDLVTSLELRKESDQEICRKTINANGFEFTICSVHPGPIEYTITPIGRIPISALLTKEVVEKTLAEAELALQVAAKNDEMIAFAEQELDALMEEVKKITGQMDYHVKNLLEVREKERNEEEGGNVIVCTSGFDLTICQVPPPPAAKNIRTEKEIIEEPEKYCGETISVGKGEITVDCHLG